MSFSDESSQGDRFTVIGGVVCRDAAARSFRNQITYAQGGFPDALKWERVRRNNLNRYCDLVTDLKDFVHSRDIDFHALVIDRMVVDHSTYNQGDAELGFNKFVVQHLFQIRKNLGRNARIRHMYASRSSPHDLDKFSEYINGMARNKWGWHAAVCLSVDHVPYKNDKMFWIADIMIGALGAAYNRRLNAGGPKEALAEHIRSQFCLSSLTTATTRTDSIDVWNFAPVPRGPSHSRDGGQFD